MRILGGWLISEVIPVNMHCDSITASPQDNQLESLESQEHHDIKCYQFVFLVMAIRSEICLIAQYS